jgi:dihydrodiol dehydrogenase / D-xylose 1-dehydrogenase (NADP)
MTEPIKWGILSTGNIAHSMATALTYMPDATITAVGSRNQQSADAFADQYNIPNRHPTYEALAADPEVDVIYIGTPHAFHYDNMLTCLNAGKHVLCEKAFTLNEADAEEAINLAQKKNLFLMEAMWMVFFPAMAQIREWVKDGILGDIRLVQADFCFNLPYDLKHRLYNPALGGGALLDLGIYPLTFATMVLGFPDTITSFAQIGQTGVDEVNTMLLNYDSGATAALSSSMRVYRPREAWVIGSKGYAKVHDIFFKPNRLTLHLNGQDPQELHFPIESNGYVYEAAEVHRCLCAGQMESELMSWEKTLNMMALMDAFRQEWGVVYPNEQ